MQSGGEGAGKGKLEALTVFSQKIQAREKGGNKQGEEEGAEHKDETTEQKREERANQQEGGWREALVALARLWPEKPEANGRDYATRGNIVE